MNLETNSHNTDDLSISDGIGLGCALITVSVLWALPVWAIVFGVIDRPPKDMETLVGCTTFFGSAFIAIGVGILVRFGLIMLGQLRRDNVEPYGPVESQK